MADHQRVAVADTVGDPAPGELHREAGRQGDAFDHRDLKNAHAVRLPVQRGDRRIKDKALQKCDRIAEPMFRFCIVNFLSVKNGNTNQSPPGIILRACFVETGKDKSMQRIHRERPFRPFYLASSARAAARE